MFFYCLSIVQLVSPLFPIFLLVFLGCGGAFNISSIAPSNLFHSSLVGIGCLIGFLGGFVMREPRSCVHQSLKPAHFNAIGRVSAEWSLLEMFILNSISKIGNIRIDSVIMLVVGASFRAWIDSLIKVVERSTEHSWKLEDFKKFTEGLVKLYKKRNQIVHAFWTVPQEDSTTSKKPQEIAKGVGFPRKGRKLSIPIEMTPKQMLDVAQEILKAELALFELVARKQPTSQREKLGQALLKYPYRKHSQTKQSKKR